MYSARHAMVNFRYISRIVSRKPLFLARLLRNYALTSLKPARPPLRFVDVAVTYKCTMHCEHCSALHMEKRELNYLTPEQYIDVARKLLRAGVLVVNITGGEPLIRPDLTEVITAFQPSKCLIAVQTNASLLTEDILRALRSAGVDSIGISIDSADAKTHDAFRRHPGAFKKAEWALKAAASMGFNVGISYVLSHDNLHSTDRQAIEALSKKFGALLNYNLAVPIGHWAGKTDNLITKEDREYLNSLLELYPQSKTDFETNYFKKGCGTIKEKLYVNAYGEVMPCPFIQVSFGNILHDEVKTIQDRAFQYRYFADYAPCCLAAEDKEFIRNTRCYAKDADTYGAPIPYTQAFVDEAAALSKSPDK